uniref:NAC family transcription factor n=1 Tax=Melilotus albus TaxID=47082 RepID=A0A896WD20_MELAB|nr:NAC family transcription factor [Melilotus albus]
MELLPPGVGFFPSEEVLVGYYLTNKNNEEVQHFHGSELIKELNLYAYDPFEFPYAPTFSFDHQRHWYCFTAKVAEERRPCRTGFWKKKGSVRDITVAGGNVVLGTKTLFKKN